MHGNDGSLVGVKVDETIAGGLTGELVRHHLEAEGISEQKQEEGVLKRVVISRTSKLQVYESSP